MFAEKGKDGLVMCYVKDGVLYPVVLSEIQKFRLMAILPASLDGKLQVVTTSPMGEVQWQKVGKGQGNGQRAKGNS